MSSIYAHFACYTNLHVKIDDVCEQAIECGGADRFFFSSVDIDTSVLLGMLQMYEETRLYAQPTRVAEIIYSSHIQDKATRRIVCCKEILHTLDNDNASAATRDAVEALIDDIIVPPSLGIDVPKATLSDHLGMLNALLVLLPRDALDELRPKFDAGDLSVEDVARLAVIPTSFARLALSPLWQGIVEKIE